MIAILVFAFIAGSVATVNPCGFALLPAYLTRRLAIDDGSNGLRAAILGALAAGGVMAFGFLLIFGVAGGVIALGADWLTNAFPWAGLVIGIIMAAAGLLVVSGRKISLGLMASPTAMARGLRGDFLFGIGFGTASLSCTLPIFLAVMGAATAAGAMVGALSATAYALGMGTVVTTLAIAAALSRQGVAASFSILLPYLNRLSGVLLLLAGLYVAYLWGAALFMTDISGSAILAIGEQTSGLLRGWLAGRTGQILTITALGLLAFVSFWSLLSRRVGK